jgi:SNF2 family DNA or RNA helicase
MLKYQNDIFNKIDNEEGIDYFIPDKKIIQLTEEIKKLNLKIEPLEHQVRAIYWMEKRKDLEYKNIGGILGDDMGLGKTFTFIIYCLLYLKKYEVEKKQCLIVTPKILLKTWKDEILKRTNFTDFLIYHGKNRNPADLKNKKIIITSYGIIKQKKEIDNKIFQLTIPWGIIGLDEGHIIRNNKTKIFKEIDKLNSNERFVISGTPFNNTADDILSLTQFICREETNKRFPDLIKRKTFSPKQWKSEMIIARKKKKILKLPKLEHFIIKLPLNQTQKKNCEKIKDEILNSKFIKPENKGYVLFSQLKQEVNDSRIISFGKKNKKRKREGEDKGEKEIGNKTKFLIDILQGKIKLNENFENDKKIIFTSSVKYIKILSEELKSNGIQFLSIDGKTKSKERDEILEKFKLDNNIKIIIISLKCGAYGLNLQDSANIEFFFDQDFNPFTELQARDRVFRLGQEKKVWIYSIYSDCYFEDLIDNCKRKKIKNSAEYTNSFSLKKIKNDKDLNFIFENISNSN